MSLPSINFLHLTVSEIQPGQTISQRPPTRPPAHPDTMGENNTPTVLKGCGVKTHFSRYGIPQQLFSDSGSQFTSQQFKEFCFDWQIKHSHSSAEYHQANSISELAVKRAKTLLSKCYDQDEDFNLALLNSRNVPREGDLQSPAQRLQSRALRSLIPTTPYALRPHIVKNVPQKLRRIGLVKKKNYDKTAKDLPPLQKGDVVRIRTEKGHKKLALVKRRADQPRSYICEHNG